MKAFLWNQNDENKTKIKKVWKGIISDNIHEDTGHIYRSLPLSGNGTLQLSEDRRFLPAHSYFLQVRWGVCFFCISNLHRLRSSNQGSSKFLAKRIRKSMSNTRGTQCGHENNWKKHKVSHHSWPWLPSPKFGMSFLPQSDWIIYF